MSLLFNKRLKTEIEDHKFKGKYSLKDIFRSYLTIEELRRHPEITPAVKGDKKLTLDILSKKKPKIIKSKGIRNERKIKFASYLNSFHKIFFDYYKDQRKSNDIIYSLSQENKQFIKKYKKTNLNKKSYKEKFNDIKLGYQKMNYYVPSLEDKKNLFNGNILLSNNQELKDYISNDLGNHLSNSKSLSFLHKINLKLGDKTSEKKLEQINRHIDMALINKDKIEKDKLKEIKKDQIDIDNIRGTINSIDDIDYFFDTNNKQYLEILRSQESVENSLKLTTRVNSANNCFENVKVQNNLNTIENVKLSDRQLMNKQKSTNDFNKNFNIKQLGVKLNRINSVCEEKMSNIYLEKYNKMDVIQDVNKSPLEKLYDEISTKKNVMSYQPKIKEYLQSKNYDLSHKINISSVCNNLEKARLKINDSKNLIKDMQLRKQLSSVASNIDKIKNKDVNMKIKMNNVEDKIIKLFCNINNPKK
jgi:hypothetical protein